MEKFNENHWPGQKGLLGWLRYPQCPSLCSVGQAASNMLLLSLRWDFWGSKSTWSSTVAGKGDS